MTDTPAGETGTALATRPASPREVRVVESTAGIFDTARFEHLYRVATVMADAGLMPESLMTYKAKDEAGKEVVLWHDLSVIRARAFLITNQADRWQADPMAVAQCTSLVHGKLMYEGKLVHGIISERLGVDLSYEFGMFDFVTREVTVGAKPETVDDQKFGCRVGGTLPGEAAPRYVHVCVSMLHTGSKGPWEKPSNWPRQLRYGGAREWCRAHKPSLLLGIMTDDEVSQEEMAQDRRATRAPRNRPDLAAKLAGPAEAARLEGPQGGFNREHVATETDEAKVEPHDPETGEVLDDGGTRLAEAEGALQNQVDGAEQARSGDTTGEMSEEEIIDEEEEDESGDVISPGFAGPGETYMLASDEVAQDDTVPIYRDGERAGIVKCGAATADLNIYREHSPAAAPPAEKAEPKKAAAKAEPEKAPEQEKSGVRDNPEDRQQPGFMEEITAMTSWLAVKPRFAALTREADWQALEPADQDAVRAAVWKVVEKIKEEHKDPVDFAADPTAFRMWIETQTGKDGADAIEGSFRVLCKEPAYTRMKDEQRDNVRNAAEARIAALRGKK